VAREEGTQVVKRRQKRVVGVFVDGTGLDRAARRLNRRVDMAALVRGVTSGTPPAVARYYTLIPYEDDSRHRAFLDAVSRAGLGVCVKRLPPKGVTRQVSVDIEMGADLIAFALGHSQFASEDHIFNSEESPSPQHRGIVMPGGARPIRPAAPSTGAPTPEAPQNQLDIAGSDTQRIVIVVCPSRDLAYLIALAGQLGADTVTADFGHFKHDDILKSASKWIDLSDSETIWKE